MSALHLPPYQIFFKNINVLFGLNRSQNWVYKDNLCFFRNVICAQEMKKRPLKFKPNEIKQADVKTLYNNLRASMPELPFDCMDFRGFNVS